MDSKTEQFYGLIDTRDGNIVRLQFETYDSSEYGSSSVPRLTANPAFPIYWARSAAEAKWALESDPFHEAATETRPTHGDYAHETDRLTPAKIETVTESIRDAKGRVVSVSTRTSAVECRVVLPALYRNCVSMMTLDARFRNQLGIDPNLDARRAICAPLGDLGLLKELVGKEMRIEGRNGEAFFVFAVVSTKDFAVVVLDEPRMIGSECDVDSSEDEPASPATGL